MQAIVLPIKAHLAFHIPHPDRRQINNIFFILVATLSFGLLLLFFNFISPKQTTYSYSQSETCFINPTFMPGVIKNSTPAYELTHSSNLKFGNGTVYSHKSCLKLKAPDNTGKQQVVLQVGNIPFFSQKISVNNPERPKLTRQQEVTKPLSIKDSLVLELNQSDKTFQYQIAVADKKASCEIQGLNLACPLSKLELEQSKTYDVEVTQTIRDIPVNSALKTTITTVSAVTITGQSISEGSLVYDNPANITITTDKPIKEIIGFKLIATDQNGVPTELKAISQISGSTIALIPSSPLPREAKITAVIDKITATDSGYLETPFTLNFRTSGGPQVTSIGLPSFAVPTTINAVISFDAELAIGQNFASLITLNPAPLSAPTISAKANRVSISGSQLNRCTNYTLTVTSGITNQFGIPSTKQWTYSFRTICQEVFSIGTSNSGRAITAYKFGNGPTKILYIGATHGDEKSSNYLLDSWINELEANYPKIPSSKTIVIIPLINPDGFAAGTRVNGRNVDLNRNFPIANWKSDVIMPDKNLLVGGGGTSPLSEPESKALADYTSSLSPRLILTYHSKGGMVVANEAGDSVAIAQTYGKSSGFWATSESKLGATFAYDTTGAYENWLAEKLSIPALLIELKTHTNNEFQTHKNALWNTVNL